MIPWKQIKAEYIAGKGSQRDLATRYGVSPSMIGRKASAEGWRQERERFISTCSAEALKDECMQRRDTLKELLSMQEMLEDRLSSILQLAEQPMGVQDLLGCTRALKTMMETAYRLYGIQTEEEKQGWERISLEKERLELERSKLREGTGEQMVKWVIDFSEEA